VCDFSYHASGKGHVHAFKRKDRLVMPPSVPVAQIVGHQKVGGFPIESPTWGYKPKPDTAYRKTAVLNAPVRVPSTIDFWLLEAGRTDLADAILQDTFRAQNLDVFATLHIDATSPQMFVVVWAFPAEVIRRTIEGLTRTKAEADAKAGRPTA
jgi:hypothetical protein